MVRAITSESMFTIALRLEKSNMPMRFSNQG